MDFLNASRATLGLVTAGGGPGTVEDPSELLKYIYLSFIIQLLMSSAVVKSQSYDDTILWWLLL